MAPPKYYILSASMECPKFEPIRRCGGQWWGVAKVEDEGEQERLEKLGCPSVTESEYEEELKKKVRAPSSLETARPLIPLGNTAGLVRPVDVLTVGGKGAPETPRPPSPGDPPPSAPKATHLRIADITASVPLRKAKK